MKLFPFWAHFHIFFAFLDTLASKTVPRAQSSASYGDGRAGKRLLGQIIGGQRDIPRSFCHLSCNRNQLCRSFNLCGRGICQLNRDDVFSSQMGENNLIGDPNCRYFGQDRLEEPTCKENGTLKSIQNDENPGVCKINKKRIDREWGPWEDIITVNNANEFEKERVQPMLVDFAHGGKIGSDEIREIRLTWVYWVRELKT